MRSIRHYVDNHGFTVGIISGPVFTVDERNWEHHAYTLWLWNPELGTEMQVPWTQGLGITADPDAADVIDALVSESWGYETSDGFADWAGEYGLDPDSREVEQTYARVRELSGAFLEFIGGRDELEKLALRYERL